VHDEFCARAFDLIGGIEVGVADDVTVVIAAEQMSHIFIATVAQVQEDVLGERGCAVMACGRVDKIEYLEDV